MQRSEQPNQQPDNRGGNNPGQHWEFSALNTCDFTFDPNVANTALSWIANLFRVISTLAVVR